MSPAPRSITCAYCNTVNPPLRTNCLACGAPLPVPIRPPVRVTMVEPITPPVPFNTPPSPAPDLDAIGQQLKQGAAVLGTGIGALGIGTIVLRSVAEGVAIVISAFLIGLNSGNAIINLNGPTPYILVAGIGGALLGLVVGSVNKRLLFTLLSAPFGAVLGTIVAITLSGLLPRGPWGGLLTFSGSVTFALLGGKRSGGNGCYQRIRPVLGLVGGLLFGLLGFAAGYRVY